MNNKNENDTSMGPQGTEVFELDDVNKMIADGITSSQSVTANTPALIGVSENVSGQCFVLNKDKLEVGRRPTSDIVLNEASVSAMHAQVIREGSRWKLLNLLSSNGTFVNGEKVTEKIIAPGDRIAFAGAEFVFSFIDAPASTESANKNTTLIVAAVALVAAFGGLLYFIL